MLLAMILTVTGGHAAQDTSSCPTLSLAPVALPDGTEGVPYSQKIRAYGGRLPVTLMLAGGAIPTGLTLSPDGVVSGTPTMEGTYSLTLLAVDSCQPAKQSATQTLQLFVSGRGGAAQPIQPSVIRKRPLAVTATVTPSVFSIPASGVVTREVSYRLTATPPETATLESPGGSFMVARGVIESVAIPLTAILINGSAVLTEKITIPQRVMEAAREQNGAKILFSRPFMGRGTTVLGVVEFTLAP